MARQNVGTPKFYIDMLSYFKAIGIIDSVVANEGTSDMSKIIGLNPADYIQTGDTYFGTNGNSYSWYYIDVNLNIGFRASGEGKSFISWLNHNFYGNTTNLVNKPKMKLMYNDTVQIAYEAPDEVQNYPAANGDNPFLCNGFSIGEMDASHVTFNKLRFYLCKNTPSTTPFELTIGSLAYGEIFQMPHSPDLQLTISREFDGIKTQQTKGGSTLTQINYTNAPLWSGRPPWLLTTTNLNYHINDGYEEKRQAHRGRRVWDLKFSYIDHKNLFSSNENISEFNISDSDTASDYEDGTFEANNSNFLSENTSYSDDSFMNRVMSRTLGGALPFVFQPDGNNNSPDQFAICQIDQDSFQFKQVAHNVYDISLKIREVW